MAQRACPSCSASMKPFLAGKVEVDQCTFCRGLWFDGGELEQVLGKKIVPTRIEGRRTSFACVTCAKQLVSAELGGVLVEICEADRGIFLDDKELVALNDGKRVEVKQEAPPPADEVSAWLDSLGV